MLDSFAPKVSGKTTFLMFKSSFCAAEKNSLATKEQPAMIHWQIPPFQISKKLNRNK
jgi:hypothetical protein